MATPIRYAHELTGSAQSYDGFPLATDEVKLIPYQLYDKLASSDVFLAAIAAEEVGISLDGTNIIESTSDAINYIKALVPPAVTIQDSQVSPFYLEVARGNKTGLSSITKFGRTPDIDVETAVVAPFDLYLPTTAMTLTVDSNDSSDTLTGSGARVILIEGLDANYDEISELVNMNGTSDVTTTNSFLRVNRAVVAAVGSQGVNDGDIRIKHNGNFIAKIAADEGITEQLIYTVPNGKNAYIIRGRASIFSRNNTGIRQGWFRLYAVPYGGSKVQVLSEGLSSRGGSGVYEATLPIKFSAKTDLYVEVTSHQFNSVATSSMQLLLEEV